MSPSPHNPSSVYRSSYEIKHSSSTLSTPTLILTPSLNLFVRIQTPHLVGPRGEVRVSLSPSLVTGGNPLCTNQRGRVVRSSSHTGSDQNLHGTCLYVHGVSSGFRIDSSSRSSRRDPTVLGEIRWDGLSWDRQNRDIQLSVLCMSPLKGLTSVFGTSFICPGDSLVFTTNSGVYFCVRLSGSPEE